MPVVDEGTLLDPVPGIVLVYVGALLDPLPVEGTLEVEEPGTVEEEML